MKSAFLLIFLSLSVLLHAQSYQRCDYDRYLSELNRSEEFRRSTNELEEKLKKASKQKTENVFIVPVVVHVIYKNSTENISDAQILSQIDALNKDFRKLNTDTGLVEPEFSIADTKIEFCLAQRDPQGNITSGITRDSTNIDNIGTTDQYYVIRPAWDRNSYLNIWVGDYGTDGQGNDILGRSSPPNESNPNKDGVIITYRAFGTTGTASSPYNKGRTTTHEVGHWLGLYHPWGVNGVSCSDDDLVNDTPNQGQVYYDCPTNPRISCGTKDMLSNYMGYVDDACMANYSEGQKERMRNTLVIQRTNLLLSKGCLPVGLDEHKKGRSFQVFPNPAKEQLNIQWEGSIDEKAKIELIDIRGAIVYSCGMNERTKDILKLNTTELENGIYVLRIRGEKWIDQTKVIIQH